jgi:hypothetical protein
VWHFLRVLDFLLCKGSCFISVLYPQTLGLSSILTLCRNHVSLWSVCWRFWHAAINSLVSFTSYLHVFFLKNDGFHSLYFQPKSFCFWTLKWNVLRSADCFLFKSQVSQISVNSFIWCDTELDAHMRCLSSYFMIRCHWMTQNLN